MKDHCRGDGNQMRQTLDEDKTDIKRITNERHNNKKKEKRPKKLLRILAS